jgi:hypothetical protein
VGGREREREGREREREIERERNRLRECVTESLNRNSETHGKTKLELKPKEGKRGGCKQEREARQGPGFLQDLIW